MVSPLAATRASVCFFLSLYTRKFTNWHRPAHSEQTHNRLFIVVHRPPMCDVRALYDRVNDKCVLTTTPRTFQCLFSFHYYFSSPEKSLKYVCIFWRTKRWRDCTQNFICENETQLSYPCTMHVYRLFMVVYYVRGVPVLVPRATYIL